MDASLRVSLIASLFPQFGFYEKMYGTTTSLLVVGSYLLLCSIPPNANLSYRDREEPRRWYGYTTIFSHAITGLLSQKRPKCRLFLRGCVRSAISVWILDGNSSHLLLMWAFVSVDDGLRTYFRSLFFDDKRWGLLAARRQSLQDILLDKVWRRACVTGLRTIYFKNVCNRGKS